MSSAVGPVGIITGAASGIGAATAIVFAKIRAEPERWRRLIETNLLGAAFSVRAVPPTMIEQTSGDIVAPSRMRFRRSDGNRITAETD